MNISVACFLVYLSLRHKYLNRLLLSLFAVNRKIRLKIQFIKGLCGAAVKISKLQHIELFKCVQNKQGLLFSLLIINKYYTPKMVLLPIL